MKLFVVLLARHMLDGEREVIFCEGCWREKREGLELSDVRL
jgi:hypothetical protein